MNNENRFSLVYKRGITSHHVPDLVTGMKQMMEPFSYPNFRFRKSNVIKDLLQVAAQLNVSFLVQFSSSGEGTNAHFVRVPGGPSLLFKVLKYTTEIQKFPLIKAPLTILNGFPQTPEYRIVSETFKNLFPSIDLTEQQIIQRVIVINYDQKQDCVQIRQYNFQQLNEIDQGLYDLTKKLKANFQNIDQVLQNQSVADRLIEIGPRLDLQLKRILAGVQRGELLYKKGVDLTKRDNKILEQKARQSSVKQRKLEIADFRRISARNGRENIEKQHKEQQKLFREDKMYINGAMEAEKVGLERLVGEKGEGYKTKKELEKEQKEKEQQEQKEQKEKELKMKTKRGYKGGDKAKSENDKKQDIEK